MSSPISRRRTTLDPTAGDFINFALADLLEADPELPAADGDASSLSLADFDASANWTLGASEGGGLLLTHPNGSVEFASSRSAARPSPTWAR